MPTADLLHTRSHLILLAILTTLTLGAGCGEGDDDSPATATNNTTATNNATGGTNNTTSGGNNTTGGTNNTTGGTNNTTGGTNNATGGTNNPTGGTNNTTLPPGLRSCPATHSRVGHVATLSRRSHGVGGTARIVDDCTIEVTAFMFDGKGLDVRFYGALNGAYSGGFSMSEEDLRRATPYAGETVYAQLPEGRTLDDMDGISVWCVPLGASFGDGRFVAP